MKPIPLLIAVIIGIVVTVFFMRGCIKPVETSTIKIDTLYHDTTIVRHDTSLVPYQVLVHGKPIEITKHDTTIIHDTVHLSHTDSIAIVNDFFFVRKYTDTVRHAYGFAVISNTVTQNKLTDQTTTFSFHISEVTKTKTEKNRLGFIGANVGAGNGIGMAGLDFLYLNKKDQLFRVKVDYTTLGSPFFEFGLGTKIKLF